MKQVVFLRLSITGLTLAIVSAITAAILPKNESKKQGGVLMVSNGGDELTCTDDGVGGDLCTYTETLEGDCGNDGMGSRTTTEESYWNTSSITNVAGVKVITITSSGYHTSHDK